MEDIIKTKPTPPKEGYEMDRENSTLDETVWKPIGGNKPTEDRLTYGKICEGLFPFRKEVYYTNDLGNIHLVTCTAHSHQTQLNKAVSEHQLKKMLAYNKLMNIAEYLNDGWKPDWNNGSEPKFYLTYDNYSQYFEVYVNYACNECQVMFKTRELAEQAIEIMGQEDLDILFKN